MPALRLATCLALPEPDPDAAPLEHALAAAGVDFAWVAWDDPSADWDAPIPTLVRTPWNYALAPQAFAAWIDRVSAAAPIWNPASVLRGNLHKRYLLELPSRGVAAAPTLLFERGQGAELGVCQRHFGADRLVAKPAIGAGSLDTEQFASGDDAAFAAHVARLCQRGEALVQPFVESVRDYGERSLVWIDGELSHAIRKTARFSRDDERIKGPLPFDDAEAALARAALAPFTASNDQLLYARVDMVRDAAGLPMVMELELIEPSLFFAHQPGSAERLVAGLLRRLSSARR
jgi:hypothetical protein